MRAQESPLARLQRHARDRGTTVAVIEQAAEQDHGSWRSLTWNELHRHVIDGAAGMIEAGVNPGQIVVIRVPTGIRQLELELATRVAGAVPLLLPDHLDPTEVGRLLDEIEVRLVVVDHARRLTLLRRAGLTEAQLFECDDRSWERLRGMGLERRKREPDVLLRADGVRDRAHSGSVLGLPREKSLAWFFRPEASGALSDLTADDVVLLTGQATDRFTTVVRDAHLTAGCTLAWVESPDQVEAALAHVSPTHVFLDHVTAKGLEDLLVGASVDGATWHETPRDVLDASSARAAEAKLQRPHEEARRRRDRTGALVGRKPAPAGPRCPRQPDGDRARSGAGLPDRTHRPPPRHQARPGGRDPVGVRRRRVRGKRPGRGSRAGARKLGLAAAACSQRPGLRVLAGRPAGLVIPSRPGRQER